VSKKRKRVKEATVDGSENTEEKRKHKKKKRKEEGEE
jgi:hypothetical protein